MRSKAFGSVRKRRSKAFGVREAFARRSRGVREAFEKRVRERSKAFGSVRKRSKNVCKNMTVSGLQIHFSKVPAGFLIDLGRVSGVL